MVPAETHEATGCLPKPQSITQLDGSVTVASTNENESTGHTSVNVPEILTASDCQERVQSLEAQACANHAEAASTELLPLNVEEALIGEENNRISHDAGAIFNQEIPEEFAFPFPDPASTLDIQGSVRSDQGSLPSSSEQLTLRAASSVNHSEVVNGGGQFPNISHGGSTVNASTVNASPRHLFSDPYKYELEKLLREEELLKKSFEGTTSELMAEFEMKMAEARSNYERESKELDAAYNAQSMEEEVNMSFVETSSLLANAFVSKCSDKNEASDLAVVRAAILSRVVQRQQALQTNTHMNQSGPLSHCNTTQPRPMSQLVQSNTHVNSTAPPPRPSVTTVEASIPNPSGSLSHFPHCTTSQPSPISQQRAVQSNTHVNSTAPPPRPSVTTVEASIPNPSGSLSHFPHCTTSQPSPISQQRAVQSNTHVNSTAPPPRPSVTTVEASIPNPSGSLSHFPHCTTSQPSPISQQRAVQSNTHVNSTAPPPRPSVTTVEASIPNPSGSLSHFPHCTTSQPSPISQQRAVQSNTHMNSTAPPQPSVTAVEAPVPNPLIPLVRFPRRNASQPRPIPQQTVVQSNTHSNSTALRRTSVTSEALPLHSPLSNTPRPRPPPVISNLTPPSSTAASSPPVYGIVRGRAPHLVRGPAPHLVRGPAPHLKPFRSTPAPISAAATTTTHPRRLVQEQEQQQGNSKGGLVYLSDDDE